MTRTRHSKYRNFSFLAIGVVVFCGMFLFSSNAFALQCNAGGYCCSSGNPLYCCTKPLKDCTISCPPGQVPACVDIGDEELICPPKGFYCDFLLDQCQCVACTPNCSGRVCGLDPVCGTFSCGPSCPYGGVCNASGQCVLPGGTCAISPAFVAPGQPIYYKMNFDSSRAASGGWFFSWDGKRVSPNDQHQGVSWTGTDPALSQTWQLLWTPQTADIGIYNNTCIIRRTNAGP